MEDGKLKDGGVGEKSNDDNDEEEKEEEGSSLSLFVKTFKGKKKKSGRKSAWSPVDVDDFIDIDTNTKCQRNGEIYEKF